MSVSQASTDDVNRTALWLPDPSRKHDLFRACAKLTSLPVIADVLRQSSRPGTSSESGRGAFLGITPVPGVFEFYHQRHIASFIDPGSWTEKTGRDLEFFPQQSSGDSCGVYMLMYALSICTSCPLTFTEEEVPLIRQWWCINLMERFCLEGHGQRFAYWTEEASQLLQGIVEPVFRVSKFTTTKLSPSRRVVDDKDIDKVQQPTIVRDLNTTWYWVQNHRHLFRGEVTEPAFLQMNRGDQQNAIKNLLGGQFSEAKDAFLFIFHYQEDMETFLSYCVDDQGLKVNAMFYKEKCSV
ncbi:uncharacterized protein LOC130563408 [Triplophysa rosa]|uniref:uncharacterized protein LOC130563408 n=1 Tax=Triplophysa rosa TaxID=992332 RepID=UPI0025460913|nr:uncharacterized protein LOC130563408 [Triplophysa rosa]